MVARTFLDTNILVYAIDEADPAKNATARTLLAETSDVVVSAQVLNEFYVTITRKLDSPVVTATAAELVRNLAQLPCVAIDAQLVESAGGRRATLAAFPLGCPRRRSRPARRLHTDPDRGPQRGCGLRRPDS